MFRKSRIAATIIISLSVLLSMASTTLPSPLSIGAGVNDALFKWSTKELVPDVSDLPFPTQADIVVDNAGNTYVLWWNQGVYFAYRPVSGGWSTPELVNDAPYQGGGSSFTAKVSIALDQSGVVYAMWVDYRNSDFGNADYIPDIAFSFRPVGGSWQPNTIVNEVTGNAILPDIAVDAFGNAYAVWTDYRNDPFGWGCLNCNTDIYFSYRPVGGNWGTNIRVNDNDDLYQNTQGQGDPAIAVDNMGNAYSVWHDNRNGDIFSASDIYFSYRPSGGTWEANLKASDDANGSSDPAIAVDANGNVYAVWVSWNNGGGIDFSYRPAGGAWGTSVRISDYEGTWSQDSPAIAVDQWGNANAIWVDYRNSDIYSDIYTSYRPTAGSWSTNINITSDTENSYDVGPAIATDSSGRAYAVWSDITSQFHNDIYFAYQQENAPISCKPNDLHSYQWDMNKINLVGALNQFANCQVPPIKIAIIDTGVDIYKGEYHPELRGKIFRTETIVGKNVKDKIGHGTHVTGIIAADQNNSTGIAGIHPNAQLLIYKISDYGPSNNFAVAKMIRKAVNQGARVINLSLGNPKDPLGILKRAIEYAENHSPPVIIVAAAADIRSNTGVLYPAYYALTHDNVIAVTSSTVKNTLAFYAVTGSYLTIAAPGGEGTGQNINCKHAVNDCVLSLWLMGSYHEDQGVSVATPHVTGVVALMLSANPNLTPAQIKKILISTASPFSKPANGFPGYGILNATKAVQCAIHPNSTPCGFSPLSWLSVP